jgi:hypothetical protein
MGKRTWQGTINHKMRSLMRFFVQFVDEKKNDALREMTTNSRMKNRSTVYRLR